MRTETDVLEPVWSCNPLLPVLLIDSSDCEEEDKEEMQQVDEAD